MLRFIRVVFLSLLAVIVFLPPLLAVLTLQNYQLVEKERLTFEPVQSAEEVLRRFDPRQMPPGKATPVSVSQLELNSALRVGLQGFSWAAAEVAVGDDQVEMMATVDLPIPANPLGTYLNVYSVVAESSAGLEIQQLTVGRLSVPQPLIRPLLVLGLDWFLGRGKGEPAFASVRAVQISGTTLTTVFNPPPTLIADVRSAAGRMVRSADIAAINAYLDVLEEAYASRSSNSLAGIMKPAFALARQRSTSSDPVEENRALILALAIFLGDARFGVLVRSDDGAGVSRTLPDTSSSRLQGRHDWVQHFVISAGLVVVSNTAFSELIGVGKEIVDSDGPSGYSFTDIGADRAGTRFAEYATMSTKAARRTQERMSVNTDEATFFPMVSDLPEGLSEAEFKARYGDITTPEYRALIQQIDDRIAQLPLYR